jgi:hypothetical protein
VQVGEYIADAGGWIKERTAFGWKRGAPVISSCQVQEERVSISQLCIAEYAHDISF